MKPDVAPASGPRRWGSGVATIVGVILDKSWQPTGSWRYKPRLRSVGLEFLDRCTAWRRPANGKAIAEQIAGRSSGPCWTSCASPRKDSKRPKAGPSLNSPSLSALFLFSLALFGLGHLLLCLSVYTCGNCQRGTGSCCGGSVTEVRRSERPPTTFFSSSDPSWAS